MLNQKKLAKYFFFLAKITIFYKILGIFEQQDKPQMVANEFKLKHV